MQEKIESEERDNSNRASFMCPNCQKTFTDLEVSSKITFRTSIEIFRLGKSNSGSDERETYLYIL